MNGHTGGNLKHNMRLSKPRSSPDHTESGSLMFPEAVAGVANFTVRSED
jgi:hypothetical protein